MPKVVTAAVLSDLNKSFKALFNKAMGNTPRFYEKICMRVPSNTTQNVYGWLASLPQIGKKMGEYIRKRLQLLGQTLVNETWGGIIEVPREAIVDDQEGMFAPVATMWGQRAAQAPDLELVKFLIRCFSATKGKDYTNSAFFGEDKKAHPKATAFTNLAAKKLSAENFQTGLANLVERKDAEGVPMFLGQDPENLWLVVCSDDQSTAEAIVNLPTLSGGGANPNYKKAKLMVLPGLQSEAQSSSIINDADARPWFILDTSGGIAPFIYQEREAFEIIPNFSETSSDVFDRDQYAWKARGRFVMGPGLPEKAYGSTGKDAA
jgi:phage major head subunit gpT-like protein